MTPHVLGRLGCRREDPREEDTSALVGPRASARYGVSIAQDRGRVPKLSASTGVTLSTMNRVLQSAHRDKNARERPKGWVWDSETVLTPVSLGLLPAPPTGFEPVLPP